MSRQFLAQLDMFLGLRREFEVNGLKGAAINAPRMFASNLGAKLVSDLGFDFGFTWFLSPAGKVRASWRTGPDSPVKAIELAGAMGGGGHANAAAAELTLAQLEAYFSGTVLPKPVRSPPKPR